MLSSSQTAASHWNGGAKSRQQLLDPSATFATLSDEVNLDVRLRKAVARLGYVRPTLVQSQCLMLAINAGRDLLVRARTGSGKTLAYCLPVLHKILSGKTAKKQTTNVKETDFVKALILVPTKELCRQVHSVLVGLTYYCDEVVSLAVLAGGAGSRQEYALQEATLRDRPDVIVATPAGLLRHVKTKTLILRHSVESLVVDEADLVLSFGYAEDVAEITRCLPRICQGYLMSATLAPQLDSLKKIVLHSPAILKLEEENDDHLSNKGKLMQFYIALPKKDKFLVVYVFLKLGLLRGKGLFFVNSIDGGYRLKLFLEQFHIRSAVLNDELPQQSRMSIIEQFNVGNLDYLIATDDSADITKVQAGKSTGVSKSENSVELKDGNNCDQNKSRPETETIFGEADSLKLGKIKKSEAQNRQSIVSEKGEAVSNISLSHRKTNKAKKMKDSEYGVSRGVDFRGVSFVLNVDFPLSPESYTHRIGRTARGGAKGVALSLVESDCSEQLELLSRVQSSQPALAHSQATMNGCGALASTVPTDDNGDPIDVSPTQCQPSLLDFDLSEIEGFRYRVEDVGRAVTRIAIKEARAAELRAEILNSERLQEHFAAHPSDLQLLQHDRQATRAAKVQFHLKNVPKYLLPHGMQVVQMRKKKNRKPRCRIKGSLGERKKDNDPLQSFEGGDVTLDDLNRKENFFEDEGAVGETESKKTKESRIGCEASRVFMDTTDGTGRSTAGRNAWKQRHSKGRFSSKRRKT